MMAHSATNVGAGFIPARLLQLQVRRLVGALVESRTINSQS